MLIFDHLPGEFQGKEHNTTGGHRRHSSALYAKRKRLQQKTKIAAKRESREAQVAKRSGPSYGFR
jgi:hypothetical protein